MIINRFENFVFFLRIYLATKENKIIIRTFSSKYQPILSIFLAYNLTYIRRFSSKYQPILSIFLAYNFTYICRFAIYGWLTKHLVVLVVNGRMIPTPTGLKFICCIFTWKLILYIDYMLLFDLCF